MSTPNSSNDASFSLDDNEAVSSLAECAGELESGDLCIVDVPTIYIHLVPDERVGEDRVSSNLRILATNVCSKVLDLTLSIAAATTSDIKTIWMGLAQIVKPESFEASGDAASAIQQFIEHDFVKIVDAIDGVSVVDEHVDVSTCAISFDVIRRYVNDPTTKQLVSSEPETQAAYGGAAFYSQLPDDETRNLVRRDTNDTLHNRLLYCMRQHTRTLCFEPNFAYNSSIKMMTLAFAYYALVCASRPLLGYSSNDLRAHYFTYILDLLVRTRVIKHWQHTSAGRALLNDLTRNYADENPMVAMCRLQTERGRVNYVMRLFKKSKYSKLGEALSYDDYLDQLRANVQIIEGERYLNFDTKTLSGLLLTKSTQTVEALIRGSTADDSGMPRNKRPRTDEDENDTTNALFEDIIRRLQQ